MSNRSQDTSGEHVPFSLREVLSDELKQTRGVVNNDQDLPSLFAELSAQKLTALCLSGGGIRGAAFGLGIIQALAKHSLLAKFDYMSTVSGGGHLGSWLSAWVCREQHQRPNLYDREFGIRHVQDNLAGIHRPAGGSVDDPSPEPSQLRYLREFSDYMSPKTGLLSADGWTVIAIYFRNVFLSLTIFIPLITAVFMLPRFLFSGLVRSETSPQMALGSLMFACLAGSFAIAFVISRLPSKRRDTDNQPHTPEAFLNTGPGVLIFGILPLVLAAFLTSALWRWEYAFGSNLASYFAFSFDFWGLIDPRLGYFLVGSAAVYVLGLITFMILKFRYVERDLSSGIAAYFCTLLCGVLLWILSFKLLPELLAGLVEYLGEEAAQSLIWQIYLCISVPLVLLTVLVGVSVYSGLTSRTLSDQDLEWLARYGGWIVITSGLWVLVNGLVLLGPPLLEWLLQVWRNPFSISGVPAIASTIAALVSATVAIYGILTKSRPAKDPGNRTRGSAILATFTKVATTVFVGFVVIAIAYLANELVTRILYYSGRVSSLHHQTVLVESSPADLLFVFLTLFSIGLLMGSFVNVNRFSLHGAYRNRLVRAYLGASNKHRKQDTFTGFDENDNIELHELANQKPLHIINAAVRLDSGRQLAWRNRKASSFTMSPLHCGSTAIGGYRRSRNYARSSTSGKALRLGTAMAISGAASKLSIGYYSSPLVTFVMSLANIRLGWWLGNTGLAGSAHQWFGRGRTRFFEATGPTFPVLPLLNEVFGRTDENRRYLMLTDGRHFEQLGLYEMVLRRCKLIVLSDGSVDPDFGFDAISNAIQKCKTELGVNIRFLSPLNMHPRSDKKRRNAKGARFAIAQITYPETYANGRSRVKGWLVYTRPTYYKTDEPIDIVNYAASHADFPHQSGGDRLYDEKAIEAYRSLGYLTMTDVREILAATAIGDPDNLVDEDLEEAFANDSDLPSTVSKFFNLRDSV